MSFLRLSQAPVVVCGAGAAGMAAAVAAARTGIPTLLVESSSKTGGTVSRALIHTLAGFYDSHGELLNAGLPEELIHRLQQADPRVHRRNMGQVYVLSAAPSVYQRVTETWLAGQSGLRLLPGSRVEEVSLNGDAVEEIVICTPEDRIECTPRSVIDTTGTGRFVESIAPDAIDADERGAAGGLIVRMRGVSPGALDFPRGIGIVRRLRTAALRGELPPTCEHLWIDRGTGPDELYLKLFVPLIDRRKGSPRLDSGHSPREVARKVVEYLREMEEFASASIEEIGELGIRDGGRLQGEYRLTVDDVRSGRTFPDAVCRAAWPIEYWHPVNGIELEMLPDDLTYEIPLRALRLRGFQNVWMAGKCLSADHLAQASARVVGTCWAMGEAVGIAAARNREVCHHES